MVELWISLVRNAACVLKSLLPPEYTVMQPLMRFPSFGGTEWAGTPLEMFTTLECLIGILQVAGACFNLLKGAKALCDGIMMTSYIVSWRNALAGLKPSAEDKPNEFDTLKEVLRRQHIVNNRKIIGGICQLVIGTGLLCLALFSWKLIGIIVAATAVAILEFALAALLAIGTISVSKMWTVSTKVQKLKKSPARDLDVVEFLVPLSTNHSAWEPDVRMPPTVATLRDHMKGMATVAQEVSKRSLEECRVIAQTVKKQATLDAFVIALNVAAFLGYGTIPLDVFYPNRTLFTLWFPPGNTAWWGNFIGDVAWTIEPMTMFVAPYLLLRQSREAGKLKSQ